MVVAVWSCWEWPPALLGSPGQRPGHRPTKESLAIWPQSGWTSCVDSEIHRLPRVANPWALTPVGTGVSLSGEIFPNPEAVVWGWPRSCGAGLCLPEAPASGRGWR